jgi:hypothetical protein
LLHVLLLLFRLVMGHLLQAACQLLRPHPPSVHQRQQQQQRHCHTSSAELHALQGRRHHNPLLSSQLQPALLLLLLLLLDRSSQAQHPCQLLLLQLQCLPHV